MMQQDRNWIFKAAYALDNLRRVKGHNSQLFVVFTHEELEKLAENLRRLAEKDAHEIMEHHDKPKRH